MNARMQRLCTCCGVFCALLCLACWIPLTLFVIWMITMTGLLLTAIARQEQAVLAPVVNVGEPGSLPSIVPVRGSS